MPTPVTSSSTPLSPIKTDSLPHTHTCPSNVKKSKKVVGNTCGNMRRIQREGIKKRQTSISISLPASLPPSLPSPGGVSVRDVQCCIVIGTSDLPVKSLSHNDHLLAHFPDVSRCTEGLLGNTFDQSERFRLRCTTNTYEHTHKEE